MKMERMVLGFPIAAESRKLDEGWDISVLGGCKPHIGAVSLAEPDGRAQTLERPGHRDGFISAGWASELAKQLNAPVCVRCGIHYDNATKQQLAEITAECDDMLQNLLQILAGDRVPR